MRKLVLAAALILPLAACDATGAGLAYGAALGAALDDDNPGRGLVVGATIGGVAGAIADQRRGTAVQPSGRTCLYRTASGGTYRAAC